MVLIGIVNQRKIQIFIKSIKDPEGGTFKT